MQSLTADWYPVTDYDGNTGNAHVGIGPSAFRTYERDGCKQFTLEDDGLRSFRIEDADLKRGTARAIEIL
jgi:arginine deiminase